METNGKDFPWLLGRVPNGFWYRKHNRLCYLRWLGDRLGFVKPDDWYGIRQSHFRKNRGSGLLGLLYSDSPQAAVRELMPTRKWYSWLFVCTGNGYWQDAANRRAYMLWLRKRLGIERKEDWYRVTKADFLNNHGAGLLNRYYNDSVVLAVREYNPRIALEEWRFQCVPQGFWQSPENRRRFMDWLGTQLKVRTPDLWYGVTSAQVKEHYGLTLLSLYGGSLYRMVQEYRPDHDWKPWLFEVTPSRFWKESENRRKYLDWLGQEVGFRKPRDWYQLRESHFKRTGGASLFLHYDHSPANAARERYPNFKWNPNGFRRNGVAGNGKPEWGNGSRHASNGQRAEGV